MKTAHVRRTLLDTLTEYRDTPWQPRGTKCREGVQDMSITAGSSAPYQNALDRTVPSQWQPQLRADLNELQAYRAAKVGPQICGPRKEQPDPDKAQAMQDRARHAGSTKSSRVYAVIDAAVDRHRLQLKDWTGSDTSRAEWLAKQINARKGKFNEDGSPSISGWRTIYNHLNTLQL